MTEEVKTLGRVAHESLNIKIRYEQLASCDRAELERMAAAVKAEVLRRQAQQTIPAGWQPIETAPAQGMPRAYLVCNAAGHVAPHIDGVIHNVGIVQVAAAHRDVGHLQSRRAQIPI